MKATKTKTPAVKNQKPLVGSTFVPSQAEPENIIQNDNSDGLATWQPAQDLLTITNNFISKETRKAKDDSNNYIADFALIAKMICANNTTWSFQDFLSMSRAMDSNVNSLAYLHKEWIKELKKFSRVKVENSIYDYEQYTFC